MPSNRSVSDAPILQFTNCRILRDHKLQREDLWVRDGRILDPEKLFFDEQGYADRRVDCEGNIIAPGFIDVQINGCHLEGPFINVDKKGAHQPEFIRTFGRGGVEELMEVYGSLDNVSILTLAPELDNSQAVVAELASRGITVSLGHSKANLSQAEEAVQQGATFITHLFNAMLPFHHRDPGIVGLLTSDQIPAGRTVYYGMIADGVHTNPAALRIAHRAHASGLVLVTDAIMAMGLPPQRTTLGQQDIDIQGLHVYVAGTKTLSGSVATMDMCVRHLRQAAGCSVEEALEAASLHPAQLLGITHRKGTLDFGSDADLVLLNNNLDIQATYIAGEEVWRKAS